MIGYKQDKKSLGKRSALNAHAAFDEADAGNTIERLVRQRSTLPGRGLGVRLPFTYSTVCFFGYLHSKISKKGLLDVAAIIKIPFLVSVPRFYCVSGLYI